jgi:hypothetical protein
MYLVSCAWFPQNKVWCSAFPLLLDDSSFSLSVPVPVQQLMPFVDIGHLRVRYALAAGTFDRSRPLILIMCVVLSSFFFNVSVFFPHRKI